jgi:hypothetical protein
MAGLPELIGLLYRADWTRLSLSAELRSETDREPPGARCAGAGPAGTAPGRGRGKTTAAT